MTGRAGTYSGSVSYRRIAVLRPWFGPAVAGLLVAGILAKLGAVVAFLGGYLTFLLGVMALSALGRRRVGRARDRLGSMRDSARVRGRRGRL